MTVFFTSDTHFCHKKLAELRGFSSPAEHDAHIIRTWNSVVKSDDIVWLLGDVGIGKDSSVMDCVAQLNGRKHLITGNHDPAWPGHRNSRNNQAKWLLYFDSVQAFARTSVCGTDFLLSHFPYEGDHGDREDRAVQYRLRDEGMPLLHGHTHSFQKLTSRECKIVHVGWDAWEKPVKDTEIKELLS